MLTYNLQTGIYRIPGDKKQVELLKESIDSKYSRRIYGDRHSLSQFPDGEAQKLLDPSGSSTADIHTVASLVKLWFRELPTFIPEASYDALLVSSAIETYEERLYSIRNLIWSLPQPNFLLLKRIMSHLSNVAEQELENQMHASNLAIVFAPTIFCPPVHKYGAFSRWS